MKVRGKCIRKERKAKTDFFNRPEPISRERAVEAQRDGQYKYKQSIERKDGGHYKKSTKF